MLQLLAKTIKIFSAIVKTKIVEVLVKQELLDLQEISLINATLNRICAAAAQIP